MALWRSLLLVVTTVSWVEPQCYLCTNKCNELSSEQHNVSKVITILCNTTNNQEALTSLQRVSFVGVSQVSLRLPSLFNFNLSNLSNVTHIDLSSNNLNIFNLSYFTNVQYLNLRNNSLQHYRIIYNQLVQLDLSNNSIENISESIFQLPKLYRLNLSFNKIKHLYNFSSDKIKYLDISNNLLENIELGKFDALKSLNLSTNSISLINKNSFLTTPNLEVLNLSSNVITELTYASFNLPGLLQLDLKGNRLKNLSQKCFFGLNKLRVLDISLNKIMTISPSTLQYLPGLVQLKVSENKGLSSQDFSLLLSTRRLQYVDASKTNQVKIPSSLTQSVRYLNLRSNNISDIRCGDLDSYPLLNTLDLAANNISYIDDDALGRLELLSQLILSNNSLKTVPHTLPNNLKHLSLDHNNIRQVTNTDFVELSQLKSLDVSFNKITSVMDGSFSQTKSLEFLNLSGNPIEILSLSTFYGTKKLKVLDLSNLLEAKKCAEPLCFPVPESNQLQELYLENSPSLASRLMNDVAALKALKQLTILNLAYSNLTEIRKDLFVLLPRINIIQLQGNLMNCSELQLIFSVLRINVTSDCELIEEPFPTTTETVIQSTTLEISTPSDSKLLLSYINISLLPDDLNVTDKPELFNITVGTINITSTEISNGTADEDILQSDYVWFKDPSPGIVYAFSSEMPASHPGLFIMLLLPIALVSTCLVINYSRLKRARQNDVFDTEVEISNFSNELW